MENKSPNKILRAVEAVEAMEDRGWDEKEDRTEAEPRGQNVQMQVVAVHRGKLA
jgi:hypothetical protein